MATQVGFQLESSLASKHLLNADNIKGGYLTVATIAERDALPVATDSTDGVIVAGSVCYVTATDKFYTYKDSAWSESLKTINGESIVGSGNVTVRTYQAFPSTFVTTGTVDQFVASVFNTPGVTEGMAYLGELECSDLPAAGPQETKPFGNVEATVCIVTNDILVIEFTTGSDGHTPYMWKYNSCLGRWVKWSDVRGNPSGTATKTLTKLEIDGELYNAVSATMGYEEVNS